jgi:hypothetical protein
VADGRETRAGIDSETVRGLLLINGGGAVALLAFLPGVLQKPEYESLARAIIWAVFTFQVGLACAVIHNRMRRICSLEYAKKDRVPCSFLGVILREPCVCHWSIGFMWSSIIAFLAAGIIVLIAGLAVVGVMPAKNNGTASAQKSVNVQSPPNPALQRDAPQASRPRANTLGSVCYSYKMGCGNGGTWQIPSNLTKLL